MKGIQETAQGAIGALNQPAANLSYIPLLQGLLDTIGWKSPSAVIYAEEKLDLERHLSLQEIEDLYEQNPSTHNRKKLLTAIDAEIAAAKAELQNAQSRQKEVHEALMSKPLSGGIAKHFSSWLMDNLKSTVGSTPGQLINHYNAIAKDRKAQIKKLSRYRNQISASVSSISYNEDSVTQSSSSVSYPSSFDLACLNEPRLPFSLKSLMGFVMNDNEMNFWYGFLVSSVGDINTDGIDDFAAWSESYVSIMFGNEKIGKNGALNPRNLNGKTGFKINQYITSITSISGGFDINADNIDDFILGSIYGSPGGRSRAGCTYVIFGSSSIGGNGIFELSSLNGINGFVINGVTAGDYSGESVSSVGDMNADGFNDIAIGAPYASPGNQTKAGSTYVVFGSPSVGRNGSLELSSLNATTGLIINGFLTNSYTGDPINRGGDINADGIGDLLISSNSNTVYVIFGNKTLGFNGTLELASLNGIRGFNITGISSKPVNYAGDINADGVDDFAIGGGYSAYVIFGGINIGGTGNIDIFTLNGKNGFKLYGILSGIGSLSYAGDLNQDGIDDFMIGAPAYNAYGFVYVIFGGSSIGSSGNLSLISLNGNNGFVLNGATPGDETGYSISSADINGDGINDIIIGSPYAKDDRGIVYVVFGGVPLVCPTNYSLIAILSTTFGISLLYSAYKGRWLQQCRQKSTKKSDKKSEVQTQAWPESSAIETMDEVVAPTQSVASYRSLPAEPIELSSSTSSFSKKSDLAIVESTPLLSPVEEKTAQSPSSSSKKSLINESGEIKVSIGIKHSELEYKKKNKLGKGAYGTVYKGRYNYNEVAIKKLHSTHLSQDALTEFKQEITVMAKMRSNYIVPLLGVCLEAPHYCLVMELMPKGSLYEFLRASPSLPLITIYQIALDIVYGLFHLHQAGIIHRDLKSLNVLLDDRLRAKVTDFGLSKIKTETSGTSTVKKVSGTLAWMAPELLVDEKACATQATDIYALGMVLWELIIKPYATPFKGLAIGALIAAKSNRGAEQEKIPQDCPKEYAKMIRSCWKKSKKRLGAKAIADNLYTLFTAAQTQPPPQPGLPPSTSTASVIPAYISNPLSAT